MQFGGGVDTGRTVTDNCFVVDSPQELLNCRVVMPFKAQTQVKLYGSYPLPGDFVVGALPEHVGARHTSGLCGQHAEIAPSLGRNLASCGTRTPCTSTATVPLIVPGTMFEDRITRLDLRLTKRLSYREISACSPTSTSTTR